MQAPFGSWPSPISAHSVAGASLRLDTAQYVADEVWWSESIPDEGGRGGVFRLDQQGLPESLLPAPWSARSRVHEYGGGVFAASLEGTLYFVNATDQRVYRYFPTGPTKITPPEPITPSGVRFGGLSMQQGHLLAIAETRDLPLLETGQPQTPADTQRAIVEIPGDGRAAISLDQLKVLAYGTDFVAHPAISPDGKQLAWVGWNHPNMPWDQANLHISAIPPAAGIAVTTVPTRAALQPEWLDDSTVIFSDDLPLNDSPDGRWNLRIIHRQPTGTWGEATEVNPANADTGGGLWVLGQRWYQLLDDGRIFAVQAHGEEHLTLLTPQQAEQPEQPPKSDQLKYLTQNLDLPLSTRISVVDTHASSVLLIGSGPDVDPGLWEYQVDSKKLRAVRGGESINPEWNPKAQAITYRGEHGPVHGYYFAPTNPLISAPSGERPPVVVWVHSGPTDHVSGVASSAIRFFTSRGIGIFDVNYSGSSGYGRQYRERLHGNWGLSDVDDIISAARELVQLGIAQRGRIGLRGGSAGGWTVLGALTRSVDFAAGVSRYGVVDLRALATETHDFERHYTQQLVGPLPEAEDLYIQRSPLTSAAHITTPVLLLQGGQDPVVPPAQSEALLSALQANGTVCEYVLFPHEGHGFRDSDVIARSLELELEFFVQHLGSELESDGDII